MGDKITTLPAWFARLLSGKPHFVIGGADRPYLLRWYLIPRNRWFNIYLHNIRRSDDDRALHDHPWWNVSIVLRGGYYEQKPCDCSDRCSVRVFRWRCPGAIVVRGATARHRIELDSMNTPAWSLFITGPVVRDWGFWCPRGWVHWKEFTAPGDSGAIGKGCD